MRSFGADVREIRFGHEKGFQWIGKPKAPEKGAEPFSPDTTTLYVWGAVLKNTQVLLYEMGSELSPGMVDLWEEVIQATKGEAQPTDPIQTLEQLDEDLKGLTRQQIEQFKVSSEKNAALMIPLEAGGFLPHLNLSRLLVKVKQILTIKTAD